MEAATHLSLLLSRFAAEQVTAKCGSTGDNSTGLPCTPFNGSNLQIILQLLFGTIAAVTVIYIIVSAIRLIWSQGDPQATTKLRESITYAAIGLVIALSAEAIVTFVLNKL